jgi:transposase
MSKRKSPKDFQKENQHLKKEKRDLERKLDEHKKKYKKLQDEFKEYKARHPVTVGVKHGKAYEIKPSTKSPSGKKRGAQKGHKPHTRRIPNVLDDILDHIVSSCPECGGTNLGEEPTEIRIRYIEDIVIPKKTTTMHIIERTYCRDCKKLVEMPVNTALPKARIGINTMLMVMYLKIGLRLPVESVVKLLKHGYGMVICEGEVCLILEQLSRAFGSYYDQLLEEVRNAPARNIDETTWRIDGEKAWLWAFITKGAALYEVAQSRAHTVPLKVLGKDHEGVDIHDRFSAYETLERKCGNPQQYCWSHILGDSKELAQFYGEDGAHIHSSLKDTYSKADAFDHMGNDEDIDRLYSDMKENLLISYKSVKCHRFVLNLLKRKDKLFEFVKNTDVEGTNNRAERGLRHSVVARKISGGSKSPKGADVYARLTSVFQSLELKGVNLLEQGNEIIRTSHG